jgi:hypothetical protein
MVTSTEVVQEQTAMELSTFGAKLPAKLPCKLTGWFCCSKGVFLNHGFR